MDSSTAAVNLSIVGNKDEQFPKATHDDTTWETTRQGPLSM